MNRWPKFSVARVSLVLVLVVAATAAFTKDSWDWLLGGGEALTQGVEAPEISDIDNETERLYRVVSDNGSLASYTVVERRGNSDETITGTSSVIAGDIVVDLTNRSNILVGEIVVNVEKFTSDSNLRDKRLRHDFLESTEWPFARFVTTAIDGLPEVSSDGDTVAITLHGNLTLKETTAAASFSGEVTVTESNITAKVSATVLGSDFGIGPINITGLARTNDEVVLTLDLVADRVELTEASDSNSLEQGLAATAFPSGAFAEHVQPILETRCVSCHTSGGIGSGTLALNTVADAAGIADGIALVTETGYMPPWSPSDQGPLFHNDWSLSDTELVTLTDWAASGGGLDVSPDTPLVAQTQLIHPVERDLESYPDEAYVGLHGGHGDDFRCQISQVDDPEGDGTWVKGLSFEPDKKHIVHHAVVYQVPATAMEEARQMDGSDGRPGWTCFGLLGMESSDVYEILGWGPGQSPTLYPDGVGVYFEPGDFIISQIHYHFGHGIAPDRSGVILDVATAEEVAAGMRAIRERTFYTPAEIPCTPEEQATGAPLCDREAALDEIAKKYGDPARLIPDETLLGCGTLEDYAVLDGMMAYSSCDLEVGLSGTVFSVLGHLHAFGATYRMTLNPDTPDEQILLDIPVWRFDWQLSYEPVETIAIESSDTLRFECSWDRSLVNLDEPRYVTWNEGQADEMCLSTIRVIPDPS